MELRRHEPRMPLKLDHLNDPSVRRSPRQQNPRSGQPFTEIIIYLIPVPVPLLNYIRIIYHKRLRCLIQNTRIMPQPHSSAKLIHISLFRQKIYHSVRGLRIQLRRMSPRKPYHISRNLDHRDLQPKTYPEERHPIHPREPASLYLPFDPPRPKAPRHKDPVNITQQLLRITACQ